MSQHVIRDALTAGYAVPAINVINLETTQAVVRAAETCGSPVILQISPGAIAYASYEQITAMAFEQAAHSDALISVHLDHCRDPGLILKALNDGFRSVMFDGSRLPFDENVRTTRDIVVAAHATGAIVEAELGYIGARHDMTISEARAAAVSAEIAVDFVQATSIDVLAPAIGSVHQMPDNSVSLDVALVREISRRSGVPIALHGGSGVIRSQIPSLIAAGVAKINLSSAVGRAFAEGVRHLWSIHPDDLDIRSYLGAGRESVTNLVADYMRLVGSAGRTKQVESAAQAIVEIE